MITENTALGFIGLGNMGGPMAENLAKWSTNLAVYDRAGTQQLAPAGTAISDSCASISAHAQVLVLSLPDGAAVADVANEIVSTSKPTVRLVLDTSTIGIAAAKSVHATLAQAGIEYVDAPVSGGRAGAIAATIAIMCACSEETLTTLRPMLSPMAKHIFHVGNDAGQGQAMKVLNNFLSGTAMAATSEAVAFGERQGLDMALMLDVLNVSTGRNTASADKFVNRVLTRTFDAGFTSTQMNKDLRLYREGLAQSGGAGQISAAVANTWKQLEDVQAGADISRMYPFIRDKD